MEAMVNAMWAACCDALPPRAPVRPILDNLNAKDAHTAVFELCKLLEVLWRVAGRETHPDERTPVSTVLKSLKSSRVVPRDVAQAGFEVLATRNRIAHSPAGSNEAPSITWQDLVGTLADCHKILDWLSRQEGLLHEFCKAVCADSSSTTVLASTPSDDWLNYRIRAVTREEIPEIVSIDRSVYDPGDIVTEEAVLSWWDTDPECLTCIEWSGDSLSGYYCMLFLKPQALERLINGTLQEKQLRGGDLYRCSHLSSPRDAYVSSIVVQNRFSPLTPLLIQHMENRFRWLYQARILRRVYAIAATPNGERLVQRFKFTLVKDSEGTADHHPLYVLDLSLAQQFHPH